MNGIIKIDGNKKEVEANANLIKLISSELTIYDKVYLCNNLNKTKKRTKNSKLLNANKYFGSAIYASNSKINIYGGEISNNIHEIFIDEKNKESQLPERCFFAWKMISGLLDISIQKYQEKCERNSVAARKRWQGNLRSPKNGMQMDSNTDTKNNTDTKIDNKTKNDTKNNTETKKTVSFQRPTLDEVKAYCQSINSPIDAEQFYNFYEAKDWMLGKNHIKKWKCCIRTWERNQTKTDKTYISDSQKEA